MSSVVAIVKSIVGQVFAVSPEGIRRVLIEGDRLFVGDQVDTGLAGAVTLELADGRTLDLGRDTQWSGTDPDSSTDLAEATAQAAPSVDELQQAIAAGADPTTDLEATAAGPSAASAGGSSSGHSFVALEATAARVDPTIGFQTAGITSATSAVVNTTGGQTTDTSTTAALRDSTLTLSATPTITEAGGVLVYTATVTQAALTDLSVTLSNGSVIVIPAGQLTGSVNVPLAPNDSVYTDPGQITVSVTGITGGGGLALTVDPAPAVTQVTDTIDTTTVTLTAGSTVTEGGQITYTATLSNPAGTPVTVTLSNGSTITIDAGKTTGTVTVDTPANDVYVNGSTVSTTITGATGGDFENLVVNGTAAETKISDVNDQVTVSIEGNGPVLENAAPTFTIKLDQKLDHNLTVTLSNGQTAVIIAGQTQVTYAAPVQGDDVYTDGAPLKLSITNASVDGKTFENLVIGGEATVQVNDTSSEVIATLTADKTTVAEGGSVTYTVTLTNANGLPVNNHGELTFTLTDGTTVTVPANSSTGTVIITAKDDIFTGGQPTIVKQLESVSGAAAETFEKLTLGKEQLTTTVTDEPGTQGDKVTVGITGDASVTEGQTAHYTLSLSNPSHAEVTVTLTYSGTAANGVVFTGVTTVKIPANSSGVGFDIKTIDDKLVEDSENFVVKIDKVSGGNFENIAVDPNKVSVTTTIVDNDHAPVSVGGAVSGIEDREITLSWDNFKVTDADGDSALSLTITKLPGAGTLMFNNGTGWVNVTENQTISQADIAANKLKFVPLENQSGTDGYGGTDVGNMQADYAQIKFKPTDGLNVGNEATLKVDITPVADAPSLTVAGNNVNSVGLIKEVWTGLSGLGTSGSGAPAGTLKSVIDAAGTPNSSNLVTNVQSDGSVVAGTASKTSGLIYLEANKSYTFTGTGDDSLLVTIGGKNVADITWSAGGKLSGSFEPTTSGYYTLDIYHHNQNGPGNYDVNLSVNGGPAVDLSNAGVPLYTGVSDLTNAGVSVSDLHGTNGEGYYEGYKLNEGAENGSVHLAAIKTALTDTDGSETLSVTISGFPKGMVVSDGAGHIATVGVSGEADVTGWTLSTLTLTPPPYYNGQFTLTVTSTSTESLGGSQPSTAQIPVTIYPAVYKPITATAANDNTVGTDGNDIVVADIGGLAVVPGQNYNIAFMVDSSGSMDDAMAAAKISLEAVFTSLIASATSKANPGIVKVFLVDFDSTVKQSISVDLSSTNAFEKLTDVLDNMRSGGYTNYEDVFKTTANWFNSSDAKSNPNAINQTYFITDGEPTAYMSREQTNPVVVDYHNKSSNTDLNLDDLLTLKNYTPGIAFNADIGGASRVLVDANGTLYKWSEDKKGNWESSEIGKRITIHPQGDGTYEVSMVTVDDNSAANAQTAFALLANANSSVVAIGLNSDVDPDDLAPYNTKGEPQTNINPSDLASAILGHSQATSDTVNSGDGNDILFGDLVSFSGITGEGYTSLQAFVGQQNGVETSKVTTSNVHQYITEYYNAFDVSGSHDGADKLLGGAGNDIIFGQGGDDLLDGGNGNDILLGGTGIDTLLGGAGDDTLLGGEGNDMLFGGKGSDILTGGSGADTFVWKVGDTGNDVIKDFNPDEGDRIDLRDLLQGEADSTIGKFLKISTTVEGVSTLQVSSEGKFNATDGVANADVTITLKGNDWAGVSVNSLISGGDPTIKVDHNNS